MKILKYKDNDILRYLVEYKKKEKRQAGHHPAVL